MFGFCLVQHLPLMLLLCEGSIEAGLKQMSRWMHYEGLQPAGKQTEAAQHLVPEDTIPTLQQAAKLPANQPESLQEAAARQAANQQASQQESAMRHAAKQRQLQWWLDRLETVRAEAVSQGDYAKASRITAEISSAQAGTHAVADAVICNQGSAGKTAADSKASCREP